LDIDDAEHEETSPNAQTLLISKLSCSLVNKSQTITIQPDSLISRIYGQHEVTEQFVCNYGLNPMFKEAIEIKSLKIVGIDQEGEVRAIEDSDHPFYIGTLYQPQLSSNPGRPHPLITAYIKATINYFATT
jgi:CTP synthase (UTP-ammonia lyase)